jgi:serpin B
MLAVPGPGRAQPGDQRAKGRVYVDIVEGNNDFALGLYAHLRHGGRPNLATSPFSLSTALAMVYAGARGETAKEMAAVLNFPGAWDQAQLHSAFAGLAEELNGGGRRHGHRLDIVNRIWVKQDLPLDNAFTGLLKDCYGATVGRMDFSRGPEEARQEINEWIARRTDGLLTDSLSPEALGPDAQSVLTNAIFFKGAWDHPFPARATQPAPFWVAPGQTVKVPMMEQVASFRYTAQDTCQILEMTYAHESITMTILLPKQPDGLADLEALLTPENLERWESRLRRRQVQVYLPRFRCQARLKLSGTLKEMGLKRPFGDDADFSGMSPGWRSRLSEVFQQAVIDVNEEGTVAAAATTTTQVRTLPPVFRADRPFVFLLRDSHSGSILFLGRLVDPTAR